MSFKKWVVMAGLCCLMSACMGDRYTSNAQNEYARSPKSETEKGKRYLLGRGVPQSDVKAFEYFKRGADEGDPFAANELAYLYAVGKGTPRDDRQALVNYQIAANHDLASAQYNLALFYFYGVGTKPNDLLAMQWLRKSAAHGFEPAKILLAKKTA